MATEVLSSTDVLGRGYPMSLDNKQTDYPISLTDWRAKYIEVADMLAETRAELDDFHHASKDLEAELENELQRTEKAQQDLKVKVARAESERDEWKAKFMSLQTNHNTITTSLQKELDTLRREHQQFKIQLRDLEMGNDDLERNERAVSSSLADMESKYSRALEEKILLEHELLEKASLEEESQRLRDELRDAMVEISILRDQVEKYHTKTLTPEITSSDMPPPHFPHASMPSEDNLLSIQPPPDLQLDELSPDIIRLASEVTSKGSSLLTDQPTTSQRARYQPNVATPINNAKMHRSSTLPSLYSPSTANPRTSMVRSLAKQQAATPHVASTVSSAMPKNKGVQMVSEMRARVRNLEQKIHTRVPRLRMGSITNKSSNAGIPSSVAGISGVSSSSSSGRASATKASWESLSQRRSADSKHSNDSESERKQKQSRGDSSGWVLILEDSPSPPNEKGREKRRISSPIGGPHVSHLATSTSIPSPTFNPRMPDAHGQNVRKPGIRRPQSRLSASSSNTSSIPTPTSRPATPTFLPLPSAILYAHPSATGISGLKRPTGQNGPDPHCQTKRSSLGSSTAYLEDSTTMPPPPRPASGTPLSGLKYSAEGIKALPQLPGLHSNITVRAQGKLAMPYGVSILGQSRIGRPSGGGVSGRKSTDNANNESRPDLRSRSGSTSTPS